MPDLAPEPTLELQRKNHATLALLFRINTLPIPRNTDVLRTVKAGDADAERKECAGPDHSNRGGPLRQRGSGGNTPAAGHRLPPVGCP